MTPEASGDRHDAPDRSAGRAGTARHLHAVPPPPAVPLPVDTSGARLAGPSRAVLAGVAALAVACVAGWWLGGVTAAPERVDAAQPIVAVGDMKLELPAAWAPARPASGADAPGTATFALAPGLPGRVTVVAGAPADASLIPAALRTQLPELLPPPRRARLAGLPAWTYGPIRDDKRVIQVTLTPTTAGVLAVSCSASPETWSAVLGCEAGVGSIASSAGAALTPAPDLAFRQRVPAAVRTLDGKRVAGRAALARGRRVAASQSLARAHRAAATTLAPLAVPGPTDATVAALRRVGAAYDALAKASGRARYIRARAGVVRSEAALAGALKRLR